MIFAISLALSQTINGSKNNTDLTYRNEFLAAHNAAREAVGVWPMVWNETVEAYAKQYAKTRSEGCQPVHSKGPYGGNIVLASAPLSPAAATKYSVDEKNNYDYDENMCINGGECRHHTQVVWRRSTQLCCANSTCKNGWSFATCNYRPAGNVGWHWPY